MKKLMPSILPQITLGILGMVLAPVQPLFAQVSWEFNYSPIGDNNPVQGGSGSFITENISLGGFYIITSMSGTFEGGSPVLQPPGSFNNDNRVFDPPFPQLTQNGFAFGTLTSVLTYNIRVDFSTRGYLFQFSNDPNNSFPVNLTLTKFQTPQPETIPEPSNLLGTLVVAGIMLCRVRKQDIVISNKSDIL
jgi:hypothetical protein